MADSSSNERARLRRHWKWLAASASVAGLTVLLCGPCESSTSQVCTQTIKGILSSLSLIATSPSAIKNNWNENTTSQKTAVLTKNTFRNSSNGSENTSRKKSVTFTAENTETKRGDPTIMLVCSIAASTISTSTNQTWASLLTNPELCKNYGLTDSPRSENSTTTRPPTRLDTASKKSTENKPAITICDATNTASRTGCCLNIFQCRLNPA